MFVVRRLHEIEWKAGVSLFMSFINLQKAYDTVDRTLLWQVLTCIGAPPQVIACVRPHGGVEAEQILRQKCVTSQLLLNIFFATVLTVVPQKFSEDNVILAELIHPKEPPASMGPELDMDYVRRAMGDMLYSDGACIVSR